MAVSYNQSTAKTRDACTLGGNWEGSANVPDNELAGIGQPVRSGWRGSHQTSHPLAFLDYDGSFACLTADEFLPTTAVDPLSPHSHIKALDQLPVTTTSQPVLGHPLSVQW